MAALVITPKNVRPYGNPRVGRGLAGETLELGETCYLKTSDKRLWKGDYASAATADVKGIVISGGDAGENVSYVSDGDIDLGATLVVAEIYCVGGGGTIVPEADVINPDFVTILGVGTAADKLSLKIHASGVAIP